MSTISVLFRCQCCLILLLGIPPLSLWYKIHWYYYCYTNRVTLFLASRLPNSHRNRIPSNDVLQTFCFQNFHSIIKIYNTLFRNHLQLFSLQTFFRTIKSNVTASLQCAIYRYKSLLAKEHFLDLSFWDFGCVLNAVFINLLFDSIFEAIYSLAYFSKL